ncbi:predicted protein [Nematostella vectensis]|uniref:Uncharacterized protein n=1 Tax=Nematostella vectensis TaxID=45351 RepID=A7S4J9_NEMVE|nr:predicted protein [Nematostella vectensis]|eukprot:XP_001633357.1 predicted protein [Nematostella vectensis]
MLKFLKGKSSKHEGKEDEEKHKAKKSSKDEKKHKKDKKKEKAASMGSLDGAGATTETRKIKKEKRKQKAASMASLDGSGPTIEKKKWRFGKKKTYEIGEAGGVTSVTKTTETRTETRPGGKTVTTTEVRTTRTRSDQRHPGVLLVQADKHDERAGRITDRNQEVDISGNRETSKIHVQKENGKRMENGKEFREDARIRSSNEEELISPEDKIESLQGETGPRNKVVTPGGKVVLIVTRKTSSGGKPAAVSDGKNVDRGNKMDPPKNVSPQMEKDIVKEEVNVQNAERSVDLPSWLEEVKEGDKPKDKMDGTVDIAFDVQGRNKPSLHSEPAVVETVKEEQVENSPEIDWSQLEDPQRRNTFTKTIITKRVKVDLPGNARQEDIPDGSTPQKWLVDVEKSPAKTPTGSDHNKGPLHVDVSLTDTKHSANDFQSQKQGMRPRTLPADGAPYIEKHLENDVSDSTQSAPGPWADMPASPGRKNILIVTRKTSSGEKPASATEKNGKDVGREKKMDSPKNMSPQTEKDRVKEEVNVQNVERSVDLPSWLEEVKEGDKPKDKMDGTVDIAFDVQGRNKPSLHSEPAVVETVKEEQVENSPEIDWSKLEDPQRRNTFTKTIITKRVKVTIPGNISQEDFTDGSSQTSEKYADMTPKRRSGIWLVDIHRSPANKTSEFEHRDPFHVDLSVSDPERSVDSYVTDGLEAEPTESRQEFTEDVDKVITTDSEPQIIHLSLESSPGSRDVTTTSEKRKSRDKYPKLEVQWVVDGLGKLLYITSLDLEDIEVLKSPDKQRPELQRQDVVTRTLTQSAVNELHTSPQNGAEPVDYKKGAKKIPGRKDSSDSSSSESDSDHEEENLRSKMRKAEFHTNGLPGSSHPDYEPIYAAVDFDAKRKKRTETGRVGKQAHSEPESNYEKLKFPHQSDYMKLQYPTKITTTNDEQVKTDNGPAHKQHFSMVDFTVGQDSTDGFQETRVRDSLPVKVEMHQRSDDGTTSSSSSDSEGMTDKKEQLRRAEQQARPTHGIRPKNWDIREKGTEIYQGENLSNRGSEDLKYWEIVGERDQANKELEFDVTTTETYKPAREGFVHRQLIYHAPKTDTTDLPRQSGTAREKALIEKRTVLIYSQ